MNNTENLMIIAMEEASEIQQAMSKALRFGIDSSCAQDSTKSNAMQIMTEYYQLQAMIDELQKCKILPYLNQDAINTIKDNKITKVKYYNEESKKAGRLNETI